MKKRIIILVIILLIFSISCVLVFKMTKPKSIKEHATIKTEQVKEKDIIDDNNTIKETSTNDKFEQEEVVKEDPIKDNKQEKKTNSTTKSNTVQTIQEEPKQVEQVQDSTQEQTKEQPKVKEQTEWEKYGMSEYDYYHKPMWDWARVDYPTHEACIEAGEALGYEILSYSCININSTAGNYLGDMLKVKYPE